ncbi:MAG: transposase, partial [Proteobacteria bacterium]|nr:transposase [Pseudomonadota bacterium]
IETILKQVERLLAAAGTLPAEAEQAVEKLLNIVEALSSYSQGLAAEVARLRQDLEKKKKAKTTNQQNQDDKKPKDDSNHSSEKRRKGDKRKRPAHDRRSFKDLTIHEEIECPVDPTTLPPDAVRVADESKVVQDIEIKPRNIRFQRHVYYSAEQNKYLRGPLPSGYDVGDFGADLRALILSLKYCGNMSEPKIREFLENFDVQISAGSVSNILTKTADSFAQEFDDIVIAGLSSTPYQQTDDTSARVAGNFWHTHILCNPFYAAYFTRPQKDRLTVLEILQNTSDLRFQLGEETLHLLRTEFDIPKKWQRAIEEIGNVECGKTSLALLLDEWFGNGNRQVRIAIEQAAAIVYYRHQTSVPVVETIVCDDAGQFKLLTERLALCWIHAGRHYEKLSPVVPRHAKLLDSFADRYWNYYRWLQEYRAGPTDERAASLRMEFDELFSTRTGYAALDDRIAKTAAKRDELLTVLSVPDVPLHNNASELQARVSARRRDVSLHSRSVRGARSMDIFTTLIQTSKILGVSAYAYLRDRISRRFELPSLATSIEAAAKIAANGLASG